MSLLCFDPLPEVWDTAKGWVPREVTRDQTTLAGRLGLPTVHCPYYAGTAALVIIGRLFW